MPGGISGQENVVLVMVDKINAAVRQATFIADGFAKLDDQFLYFLGEPAKKDRYRGEDYISTAAMYFSVDGNVYTVDVHAEYVTLLGGDAPPQVMAVIEKIENSLGVAPRSRWKERRHSGVISRLLNL